MRSSLSFSAITLNRGPGGSEDFYTNHMHRTGKRLHHNDDSYGTISIFSRITYIISNVKAKKSYFGNKGVSLLR